MSIHLSPHMPHQHGGVEPLVRDALRAMRAASVQDGDLHVRVTNMLEKYWDMRAHMAPAPRSSEDEDDGALSVFTCRLGASLTFGFLRRCKRDVEAARDANTPNPTAQVLRREGVEMREFFFPLRFFSPLDIAVSDSLCTCADDRGCCRRRAPPTTWASSGRPATRVDGCVQSV